MILAPLLLVLGLAGTPLPTQAADPVVVGSKRFTESYVLGEVVRQAFVDAGVPAVHRQGLGNTAVMEQAMREDHAARLGIATLSDLAKASAPLRFGLSHEFLLRADGWGALKAAYGMPFAPGSGLDHGLAYQALARQQVDVMDVYTTDAQIARLGLRVLRDDRNFFPRYDAVLLMQAQLDEGPLATVLAGRIDERAMQAMNAEAELDGKTFEQVARDFIARNKAAAASRPVAPTAAAATHGQRFLDRLLAPDLPRLLREHVTLVFASVAIAAALGIPAGVLAARRPRLGRSLLGLVGMLQTVPSLALLAFLIAVVGGIGFVPALLALALYALLPIVRNTHAGLVSLPPGMRQAGLALGLREGQVLRSIELPLAAPTIFAGIQTAAVLNVGVATVATFIGAGGLGERIVAGLAVNDTAYMLAGAVPAAILALLTQWGFDALEWLMVRRRSR